MDHDNRLIDHLTTVLIVLAIGFISAAPPAFAQDSTPDTHPPIRVHGNAQPAVVGYLPDQIRRAYGFDQVPNQGAGQVIGIVDAYNHPRIEHDLAVFNLNFGLPACTTDNGCFQRIYATGARSGTDTLWALEEALDVEWTHAIAPGARILLVEAHSARLSDMLQAVDVAVRNGATVVSMSWGTYEFANEVSYDNHFIAAHVTFVAASGDFGNPGFYPAASPFVTGVGGTTLFADSQTSDARETAWNGSGGGVSPVEAAPSYQYGFNPHLNRGLPDVAYNADPNTGFAVYDSVPYRGYGGWIEIGGTSAGAPQWAALVAIANALRLSSNKLPLTGINDALYGAAMTAKSYKMNYHDIIVGTNGSCGAICSASTGYDFVTGLGSPDVPALLNVLVKAQ